MLPAQPVPAQMPNMTMSTPVGTRVSMRANKGQTSKYDDFLQQITLKPGTYASDGNNLYMLEDIGNTSSMRNLLTTFPTWQQKINQTWSPDTAYVQQLACDSHCQTPWSPTYWNTDMASQQGVVMNTNVMNDNMMNNNRMYANMMTHNMMTNNSGNMMNTDVLTNMMNTNMMNSNVMSYKRGYLNNDGYSCYEDSSPRSQGGQAA